VGWVLFCIDTTISAWPSRSQQNVDNMRVCPGDRCSAGTDARGADSLNARGVKLICYYALERCMQDPKSWPG